MSIFFFMDYLTHGDLNHHINRPFQEAHVKQITRDLLHGWDLMYKNKFTHRDLKPDVCIFQPNNRLPLPSPDVTLPAQHI